MIRRASLAAILLVTAAYPSFAEEIRDGPYAPEMVVIPAGEFIMGTPAGENGRKENEGPQHRVQIASTFAVGKYGVTRDEFAAFIADSGYHAEDNDGCYHPDTTGKWSRDAKANWRDPGIVQTGNDPVVCVSWNDAMAYVKWLTRKTGHRYRLLSEAEWEYAARAGTTSTYYWGDVVGVNHANCDGCDTRWSGKSTSPSGSFSANAFGLYDMAGNAWQMLADCWTDSYAGAPPDGRPVIRGHCEKHAMRGGSWSADPTLIRTGFRGWNTPDDRSCDNGFRVARDLD